MLPSSLPPVDDLPLDVHTDEEPVWQWRVGNGVNSGTAEKGSNWERAY